MIPLNLPPYQHRFSDNNGKKRIFDPIRKKMVTLTPEEWVRQNFIQYLIQAKEYPASLMAVEALVKINGLSQRSDLILYSTTSKPMVVVECKAPTVKISQNTFDQVARYNSKLQTQYLIVTNGLNHYCAKINLKNLSYIFLQEIPSYNSIKTKI